MEQKYSAEEVSSKLEKYLKERGFSLETEIEQQIVQSCVVMQLERLYCEDVRKDLYKTWKGMLYRCNNPKSKVYHRYGGRGIKVCERWLEFDNFIDDMGERPGSKFHLDRIDNDKGYHPDNCQWITPKKNHPCNKKKDALLGQIFG